MMLRQCGRAAAILLTVALVVSCGTGPGSPSVAPSSADPGASASGGVTDQCPIARQSGALPSDRLTAADVESTSVADRITFRFGPPSGVIAGSMGFLREVEPPFFEGGSGEEVTVAGERFVEVRFEALLIVGEDGVPTYQGERDRRLDLPAIVEVAVIDEFEGVMTWIVGIRGPGCVSLGADPGGIVTLDVLHG